MVKPTIDPKYVAFEGNQIILISPNMDHAEAVPEGLKNKIRAAGQFHVSEGGHVITYGHSHTLGCGYGGDYDALLIEQMMRIGRFE